MIHHRNAVFFKETATPKFTINELSGNLLRSSSSQWELHLVGPGSWHKPTSSMAVAMQHDPAGSKKQTNATNECSKMFRTPVYRKKYLQRFVWPRTLVIFSHLEPVTYPTLVNWYTIKRCTVLYGSIFQRITCPQKYPKSHNTSSSFRVGVKRYPCVEHFFVM